MTASSSSSLVRIVVLEALDIPRAEKIKEQFSLMASGFPGLVTAEVGQVSFPTCQWDVVKIGRSQIVTLMLRFVAIADRDAYLADPHRQALFQEAKKSAVMASDKVIEILNT